MSTSCIELNPSAIQNNYEFIKSSVNDNCKISYVVKGNAYGHGIEAYIPEVLKIGVSHFSVFSGSEAKRVKKIVGNKATLLVMGYLSDTELEWCIKEGVEFYVFNSSRLEKAIVLSEKLQKKAKIHLELETGMNRAGFGKKDLQKIIPLLKNDRAIDLVGICTHFAGAESISNYHRVKKQISTFESLKVFLQKNGIVSQRYHTACSAAMLRYPSTQMDMVRVGILQYGFWPSNETYIHYLGKISTLKSNINKLTSPLKRVLEWKSTVMNIKHVSAGSFVGYGTSFLAEQNMKIAAVPVGYAYGYSRNLSNLGRVLIQGHRLSVIGIVNMNMMLVDATLIKDLQLDDEVVLIGKQAENEITVQSFSELNNMLNYEMLTRLPSDIERIIKLK